MRKLTSRLFVWFLLLITLIIECGDKEPPEVQITNPLNGQVVSGTVNITAEATDNKGVDKVVFYINGDSVFTITSRPYKYTWITTSLEDSTIHNIYAKAYDAAKNEGISTTISVMVYNGSSGQLETPDVVYQVLVSDYGGSLELSWGEIIGADGYLIYADGECIDTVMGTYYIASLPAKRYEVIAFSGQIHSEPGIVNTSPIITTTLNVWDYSDPDTTHPSGFGFTSDGYAVAYSLSNSNNWPYIDQWIGYQYYFYSPDIHVPPFNNECNATKNSYSTNFDEVDIADPPGSYMTASEVVVGSVYYLWIDPNNNGWDNVTDHYAKIHVLAISGLCVTMKIAYQPIPGLRWLVTP